MAAIQLNFALRTSANCKTVHLLGSWDNYNGQLPLSKDSAKAGSWKGAFRFQAATLKQGQRYWYYYIVDGYHVSHDPAKEHTVEPTTGRKLNILDVPVVKSGSSSSSAATSTSKRHSRRVSADIPKGRPLSPSKIVSPKPIKPNQTRHITTANYEHPTVDQITSRFSAATISENDSSADESSEDDEEEDSDDDDDSDVSSNVPSLTSTRSASSRASSVSSTSSCCTCERYGITRAGDRVKLDCGGSRCGSDEDSCSSESEAEIESRMARRNGLVIRS